MPTDNHRDNQWQLLVTELQDCQDEQRQEWGDIDDVLLSRYLAGECDQQERERVEQAGRSFPAVRECIDMAKEVLHDSPAGESFGNATLTVAHAMGGASNGSTRRSFFRRAGRAVFQSTVPSWVAAACLFIVVGVGALVLAHIKTRSADSVASIASELSKLRDTQVRVAAQLGVQKPDGIPEAVRGLQRATENREEELVELPTMRDTLAAQLGVETPEGIPEAVRGLQRITKNREEELVELRTMRDTLAAQLGVETPEGIPETALALRQTREVLQKSAGTAERRGGPISKGQFALSFTPGFTCGESPSHVVNGSATVTVYRACRVPYDEVAPLGCFPQTVSSPGLPGQYSGISAGSCQPYTTARPVWKAGCVETPVLPPMVPVSPPAPIDNGGWVPGSAIIMGR